MRILIYVPTITFDSCVGNSVHVRELAQNLLELGNEVVVIANLSNSAYDGIVAVRSTKIPRIGVLGWLIAQIQALFLVILETAKNKCQLVYTRFGFSSGPCLLMARLTGIPSVIEVNGFPRDEAKVSRVRLWGKITGYLTNWISDTACRYAQQVIAVTPRIKEVLVAEYGIETDKITGYLTNWVSDTACRYAQQVIAVSPQIKEVLVATLSIKPEKIAMISNGANTDLFKPMDTNLARRQLNLSGADYFVTFVGMLAAWQGVEYLIRSALYILEECPESKFVIVGDGPMKQGLIKLAKEVGASERVAFTGRVPYDKVPLYINASDICAAPFIRERNERSGVSPLKIYEYGACGKAIVTSRLPGLEFIEQYDTGVLIQPDNAKELARAIMRLLQNPELKKQMGENGRKFVVENHSWESVAKRVAELCEQTLHEHEKKRNKGKP